MSLPSLALYDENGTPYRLGDGRLIRDLHPDDVRDVLAVFDVYADGLPREEAMAHALEAWRACRMKRALDDCRARRTVVSGSQR